MDNCPICEKPLGDEPCIQLKQERAAKTCNRFSKIRKLDFQFEANISLL